MKTMGALYQEILANEELQKSFAEAVQEGSEEDFLKANGCETAKEKPEAFLQEEQQGELADEMLDGVAGGIEHSTTIKQGELELLVTSKFGTCPFGGHLSLIKKVQIVPGNGVKHCWCLLCRANWEEQ